MRTRSMVPLAIGAAGVVAAFLFLVSSSSDMGGFLGMATLAFILGDIVYVIALFATYMLTITLHKKPVIAIQCNR